MYGAILAGLGIERCPIEQGKPWQNLIEAQCKIQLRLADATFERATSFEEVQAEHAMFIETFNTTAYWAHQEREDGLRTPVEVLQWARGRLVAPDLMRQLFRHVHLERTVDPRGYVRVQRFSIYAERGLARKRVSVWLYDGRLHSEYQQTLLAHYAYRYDRNRKRLRRVEQPQLQSTRFTDPQLE